PILIVFSVTSYFAYESFNNYQVAKNLQEKLAENRQLNNLVENISRERGMTIMYLGDSSKSTLKSLIQQRKIVDSQFQAYETYTTNNTILESLNIIKKLRILVDKQKTNFEDVYKNIYGKVQNDAILELEKITKNQIDSEINELSSVYISLVRVKEFTASERDLISFILAGSTKIDTKKLNLWISLITKSTIIQYDTIQNKNLIEKLDLIFKNEDNKELLENINKQRTSIISSATIGKYDVGSTVWFAMLSQKVNTFSDAQDSILSTMDKRASDIQNNVLNLFIISVIIWFISIVLAILGFLLSNEITRNIKNLENVLKSVAEGTKDSHGHNIDINLHSSKGTAQAYKLLEAIIEQTREDKISAQEANEAKSMFLANMSHEIRTPLNGIVGFTELLKDTGLEEEQKEFVEIIEKSSENLLEIINNILDLSKIESNKLEIENIIFNPIEEFESAVEVYAVRASEKHINLGFFIDPQLEQPIKGDPTKIKEVIINLLSNAVKFTSNSGAINVSIKKLDSQKDNITRIKFEVQDTGIGVTSEQKANIFEAFGQADTSITRKYGGTGLGLTISSRFIELMGGRLDLYSESGKGTTFFFSLDFEEVETSNDTVKGNFSNINALILENTHKSKIQGTYLLQYLDFYGVSYTMFKDMEELKLLQSQVDYDLLLVDYDYCAENSLVNYSAQAQEFILLTKATYMKKLDLLNLNIFKTIYEPLNSTKIKSILDTYSSMNFKAKKSKKVSRKKFQIGSSRFKANVLIAEDNIINQKLIKRTLEDIGLTITIANNGLEAFQKRKDGNFDLIFMDIQMPFLDGVEATKEILEYEEDYNQTHVPIIALTANALKGDRERFLKAGLDEYTTKPLVRTEIISLLNHFLADYIVEEEQNDIDEIKEDDEDIMESFSNEIKKDIQIKNIKEEIEKETVIEDIVKIEEPLYKADILLAKKRSFETKLYIQLLESLGYTYDIAYSQDEIDKLLSNYTYKVILFDKECQQQELSEFSKKVQEFNEKDKLNTVLVLVDNPLDKQNNNDDELYVHEVIKKVVNKDLLKQIFKKII
ncbi:MAG: response regulator, partial [Sulfurimonas sp.]|nr:response regulator [Sulfurimonas sp.]